MGEEILIVGGGVAGLALAGFLERQGRTATVVEQAEEWKRVGWGIGLWGNGLAVLDELGVGEGARDRGTVPEQFVIRGRSGRDLASVDLPSESMFVVLHRADLHAALRGAVPSSWLRMGTRVKSVEEAGDDVAVTLEDGSVERYDLVIGADGIGSQVRETVFEDWTVQDRSTVTWSFWMPPGVDLGTEDAMVSRWLPGTEVFLGRVDGRGLVNIATRMPPGPTPEPPALDRLAAVAERIGGMMPDAVDALQEDAVFFDRNREVRAGTWTADRTALIGDAAHALHPISGMGAALALEDAYVLADELSEDIPVERALERYEKRRKTRVRSVRRMAHVEERITFTGSSLAAWIRDVFVRRTPLARWFLEREAGRLASFSLEDL